MDSVSLSIYVRCTTVIRFIDDKLNAASSQTIADHCDVRQVPKEISDLRNKVMKATNSQVSDFLRIREVTLRHTLTGIRPGP